MLLILLEMDDDKIIGLNERNELRFYTARIIVNLVKSKTSPFYKKYRTISFTLSENIHQIFEIEERQQREFLEDTAMNEIQNLYWYDKEIVQMYLKHGTYRAIEKETGIKWEAAYKTVQKVIRHIRGKVTGDNAPVFSKSELRQIL